MLSTLPTALVRQVRRHRVTTTLVVAAFVVAAAVVVPLVASGTSASPSTTTVAITNDQCGGAMSLPHGGRQTFSVVNRSRVPTEVVLENLLGGVVAGLAVVGPGTTVNLVADIEGGSYSFNCFSGAGQVSSTLQVAGPIRRVSSPGVQIVTQGMLIGPNDAYLSYAATQLSDLSADVATIEHDLEAGDLNAARSDWLTAMTQWERVGASYDSFGSDGEAVDGLPGGLPGGVDDPRFSGLHRLEYGLWHGQSAVALLPVAQTLSTALGTLQTNLDSNDVGGNPTNLPTRAHEILEDALRDHLSGLDDFGAGAAYAETSADLQVTRTVLGELAPLITSRAPQLLPTADAQMQDLQNALAATEVNGQWLNATEVPRAAHEKVDAAIGALLQTLSAVPDILQVAGNGADGD